MPKPPVNYPIRRCPKCASNAKLIIESSYGYIKGREYWSCLNAKCRYDFYCEMSLNMDTGELKVKTKSIYEGELE